MRDHPLSNKLRAVRRQQGLSLATLASKTGLTKGFLSLVERGKKTPSISTLLGVARALGVPVGNFFERSAGTDAQFSLVRRGEGRWFTRDGRFGGDYKAVAFRKKSKQMEPFEVSPPRIPKEFFHHDGEEMVYVLSGRIGVSFGDKYLVLNHGDCLYFDASIPHRSCSLGKQRARALVVVSTPGGTAYLVSEHRTGSFTE